LTVSVDPVSIVVGLVLLAWALLVPTAKASAKLIERLKFHHTETWEELGSPEFGMADYSTNRRPRQFLKNRDHVRLQDDAVDSLASRLRVLNRVVEVLFIAVIGVAVWSALR
jgi:hypothetical protein